eukprot:356975-Chlamydomonas_euryale.AAC.3
MVRCRCTQSRCCAAALLSRAVRNRAVALLLCCTVAVRLRALALLLFCAAAVLLCYAVAPMLVLCCAAAVARNGAAAPPLCCSATLLLCCAATLLRCCSGAAAVVRNRAVALPLCCAAALLRRQSKALPLLCAIALPRRSTTRLDSPRAYWVTSAAPWTSWVCWNRRSATGVAGCGWGGACLRAAGQAAGVAVETVHYLVGVMRTGGWASSWCCGAGGAFGALCGHVCGRLDGQPELRQYNGAVGHAGAPLCNRSVWRASSRAEGAWAVPAAVSVVMLVAAGSSACVRAGRRCNTHIAVHA